MEILDIVDENGEPTGKVIERSKAHETGVRHRTSHVWVFRKKDGKLQVLLQKRSRDKDAYPGCLDTSSAGHIPAGCGYIESAIRELKEELGIDALPEEFIYCGTKKHQGIKKNVFHGKKFLDHQVSNVYIIFKDVDAKDIDFQKEEIEQVLWMDFHECIKMVENKSIPNCISMLELNMLQQKLNEIKGMNQ